MRAGVKTGLILIVLCLCCIVAGAQDQRQSISVHWGVTIPPNNGFIDKVGVVNPSLEWSYKVLPTLSAGVSLGYGYATEKGEGSERVDGDFASGYREKTLSSMPLIIRLRFCPLGTKSTLFSPYIGVGAGVQYSKFHITGDAINSNGAGNWAETFSAEVGTRIQPKEGSKLYFDVRGLWQYGGNDWPSVEAKSIQHIGFALGVGIKF